MIDQMWNQMWINALSVALGVMFAASWLSIFMALGKWVSKPYKDKKIERTIRSEYTDRMNSIGGDWNIEKSTPSKSNYRRYYHHAMPEPRHVPAPPPYKRNPALYKRIYFTTREDAQKVLAKVIAYLDAYGRISVGHYYSLTEENSTYEDSKVGWKNLYGRCDIVLASGGYTIDFPAPTTLN